MAVHCPPPPLLSLSSPSSPLTVLPLLSSHCPRPPLLSLSSPSSPLPPRASGAIGDQGHVEAHRDPHLRVCTPLAADTRAQASPRLGCCTRQPWLFRASLRAVPCSDVWVCGCTIWEGGVLSRWGVKVTPQTIQRLTSNAGISTSIRWAMRAMINDFSSHDLKLVCSCPIESDSYDPEFFDLIWIMHFLKLKCIALDGIKKIHVFCNDKR